MTTKRAVWHAIAVGLCAINLAGLGFAVGAAEPWHAAVHGGLAMACWLWARRLRHGPGGSEMAQLQQLVEQQAAALEDARNALDDQSGQLAELQERVDFAERMLIQARERQALDARQEPR